MKAISSKVELSAEMNVRARKKLIFEMQKDAILFAEYDQNMDRKIDFGEFLALQPKDVRDAFGAEEIRVWFDAADVDRDGTLSIFEFFRWSAAKASKRHGAEMLESAFHVYDKDSTGHLDAIEFEKVCTDLGFGSVSYEIFSALDSDGSGTVAYGELVSDSTPTPSHDCASDPDPVDTTGWIIQGRDAPHVQSELQKLLHESGLLVVDLMKVFEKDMSYEIDSMEFFTTMRERLGFRGEKRVLDAVFKNLDDDGNGVIGYDELYEFIRGRKHSLDERHFNRAVGKLVPEPQLDVKTGLEVRPSLEEIAWDPEALRILIKQMLGRCNLAPTHLLRAWDGTEVRNGSSGLTRVTFATHVRELLRDEDDDLWVSEVAPVADATFDIILKAVRGGNMLQKVGIVHLVLWLNVPPGRVALPLKTRGELKRMRARRLDMAAPAPSTKSHVDLSARAREAIEHAAARAKDIAQAKAASEVRHGVTPLRRNGLPPLQRWEVPRSLEPPPKPSRAGLMPASASADALVPRCEETKATQPLVWPGQWRRHRLVGTSAGHPWCAPAGTSGHNLGRWFPTDGPMPKVHRPSTVRLHARSMPSSLAPLSPPQQRLAKTAPATEQAAFHETRANLAQNLTREATKDMTSEKLPRELKADGPKEGRPKQSSPRCVSPTIIAQQRDCITEVVVAQGLQSHPAKPLQWVSSKPNDQKGDGASRPQADTDADREPAIIGGSSSIRFFSLPAPLRANSRMDSLAAELVGVPSASEAEVRELSEACNARMLDLVGYDPTKAAWFKFYRRVDSDQSGRIDFKEFRHMLRVELQLSPKVMDDYRLKTVWVALDVDSSGYISAGEFGSFMNRGDRVLNEAKDYALATPELQRLQQRLHFQPSTASGR